MNAPQIGHTIGHTENPSEESRKRRKKETKNLTRRNEIWQFSRVVNGKRQRESLGTRDLVLAKAKRDALLKASTQEEIDRILGRNTRAAATCGQIFAAYRAAPTVRANAATRERNIADLVRLVRAVLGATVEVERLSSCALTKELVKDWQARRLEAIRAEFPADLPRQEAAKRALNSTLTHVQSLFSAEARDDYGRLYLPPNLGDFATALPVPARRQEEPTQLDDAFVARLLAAAEELAATDPGAWIAFELMVWGGLRNKEVLHARVGWLAEVPAGYRLELRPDGDFLPKGNSRAVILPRALVRAILDRLPHGAEYLVPGRHATDRHEAVYRRVNAWLKAHGVIGDAGKIAYRLRKYFLKKVEEQQGSLFAQVAAGHSSFATTQNHYLGKPKMAEPIRLGLNSVPPVRS